MQNYLVTQISWRVITPQQTVEILKVPIQDKIDDLHAAQSRIDFEVCFCSVYDDC